MVVRLAVVYSLEAGWCRAMLIFLSMEQRKQQVPDLGWQEHSWEKFRETAEQRKRCLTGQMRIRFYQS
jgi:hypothetical protein